MGTIREQQNNEKSDSQKEWLADELKKGAVFKDFVLAYVEGSKRTEDEETMLKKVG